MLTRTEITRLKVKALKNVAFSSAENKLDFELRGALLQKRRVLMVSLGEFTNVIVRRLHQRYNDNFPEFKPELMNDARSIIFFNLDNTD